jgi:hypothetical protein
MDRLKLSVFLDYVRIGLAHIKYSKQMTSLGERVYFFCFLTPFFATTSETFCLSCFYIYSYIEYHSVCPLVRIGTPHPLSRKRVPPPRTKRAGWYITTLFVIPVRQAT